MIFCVISIQLLCIINIPTLTELNLVTCPRVVEFVDYNIIEFWNFEVLDALLFEKWIFKGKIENFMNLVSCINSILCFRASKSQPESKCPELLANYSDMLLRKTALSKKLTSDEIEKKLRDLVSSKMVLI